MNAQHIKISFLTFLKIKCFFSDQNRKTKKKKKKKMQSNNKQGENQNTTTQNEMIWTGASLKSVPVNIIQYCLWKAEQQQQPNTKKLSTSVRIHLSKGHYRYRAEKLCSIDEAMNVRLENVVVSKVKREYLNQLEGKQQTKNVSSSNFVVGAQIFPGQQQPSSSSSINNRTNNLINNNVAGNQVPWNEQAVDVKKSILLPGSSIMMIELPNEWTDLFDTQARAVRGEFYRRVRETNRIRKEEKQKKRQIFLEKKKEKKAKKAEKTKLLKAGANKNKNKK
jgi:hypothetical protein